MERQETLLNPVFNRKQARQPEALSQAPAATSTKLADFCERLHAIRSSRPQYVRYLETISPL
ncbi:hypothetical protein CSC67_08185 [Pusillimonas caeni]|uniref:hypothetical protein n=1 Tax=Pusillimonas caeni TaxID=1348472 RepID=UPI00107538B7|nr:hypothetical protein [Pusillimonas caeni]TFL14126.1 hypothetical protein CSC67_08185 [Pusillimonas caeni]